MVELPIKRGHFAGGAHLTIDGPGGLRAVLNEVDQRFIIAGALTDYVPVEALANLAAPVGGAIQLADDTVYRINGSVDLGVNHLVYGTNTIVLGEASQHDGLISTTTGGVLRAAGGDSIVAKNFSIAAPAGMMFDGNGCPNVFINSVVGSDVSRFAVFEDCAVISILLSSGVGISGANAGIQLINSSFGQRFAMVLSALIQDSAGTGVLLDLGTSTWASIAVDDCEFVSAVGGTDISGLASNGNLVAIVGRARIFGNIINGAGTHLVGLTTDDTQWNFKMNVGVPDSFVLGSLSMMGNAVETVIASSGVFVKAAGDTALTSAHRVDDDGGADNAMRLIDVDRHHMIINVTATLSKSGASKACEIQMFLAGNPIGIPIDIDVAAQPNRRSFTLVAETVSQNEVLEFRVSNTIDTDNIVVEDLSYVEQAVA